MRIGPNRVAFNDVAGLKSVYSVGRFDKGPFYRTGSWVKGFQAFSILEHAPHSARRKIVAPHYTPDNMRSFEPEIQAIVGTMLSTLETIDKPVDCLAMFHHLMMDVILVTAYDCHLDAVQLWASGTESPVLAA